MYLISIRRKATHADDESSEDETSSRKFARAETITRKASRAETITRKAARADDESLDDDGIDGESSDDCCVVESVVAVLVKKEVMTTLLIILYHLPRESIICCDYDIPITFSAAGYSEGSGDNAGCADYRDRQRLINQGGARSHAPATHTPVLLHPAIDTGPAS
mgnify:CR=1 FL=1